MLSCVEVLLWRTLKMFLATLQGFKIIGLIFLILFSFMVYPV